MLCEDEAEDGEILEDSEDGEVLEELDLEVEPYRALERPVVDTPVVKSTVFVDSSSESSNSSEDSDSDDERPIKRKKKSSVKVKQLNPKKVKHSLWSSVLLEDHIERELKDINVQNGAHLLNKSRDVESYNYPIPIRRRLGRCHSEEEDEQQIRNTLAVLDRKDGANSFKVAETETKSEDFDQHLQETKKLMSSRKRTMNQRTVEKKEKSINPAPLRVEDLSVTTTSSQMEVALDIAAKLHENKTELISRVVELLGKEIAIQLFKDTQETENNGGILVADGSRRRTPGGVFLHLLRIHEEIPMQKIKEVFQEENKARERIRKTLQAKRRSHSSSNKQNSVNEEDLPELPTRSELFRTSTATVEEQPSNMDEIEIHE